MSEPQELSGPRGEQRLGDVPRGIEVLVKKASVDPEFKQLLLNKREAAAASIGLALDPAEVMMLRAAPAEQLEAIIAKTEVSQEHRRVFLGKAAAAMVAVICGAQTDDLSGGLPSKGGGSGGVRPDAPAPAGTFGIRPEEPRPDVRPEPARIFEDRVRTILSTQTGVPAKRMGTDTALVRDLHIDPETARRIRGAIFKELGVRITDDVAAQLHTVGQLVDAVMIRSRSGQAVVGAVARQFKVAGQGITCRTALPRDLKTDAKLRAALAKNLSARLRVVIDEQALANVATVGDLINMAGQAIAGPHGQAAGGATQPPPVSRGIQPDVPKSFGVRPR